MHHKNKTVNPLRGFKILFGQDFKREYLKFRMDTIFRFAFQTIIRFKKVNKNSQSYLP